MENYPIDFVLTWVDDTDPNWLKEKEKYWKKNSKETNQDANSAARFRDWDNLKYWFRGVEKFAPWVNKIFFVTYGHVPNWLNTKNSKLVIINHKDFIPEKYLPVFQVNPIEINFHRINELSEHFVYFNDDMFVTNYVKSDDFFYDGLPREMAIRYPLCSSRDNETYLHMLFTMSGIINNLFNTKQCIRKNWIKWYNPKYGKYVLNNIAMSRFSNISGLMIPHVPSPLTKSTMKEVWEAIESEMTRTSFHKFREVNDINQYIFRYWAIMKGEFKPTNILKYSGEFFYNISSDSEICESIEKQKYKMICINDNYSIESIENIKNIVKNSFEKILPEKSSFEK